MPVASAGMQFTYTVEYRYNAVKYIKIVTLSIAIADGKNWPNMSSQQAPHVPPLPASHRTSTVSYMDIKCRVILGFSSIMYMVYHGSVVEGFNVAMSIPEYAHK